MTASKLPEGTDSIIEDDFLDDLEDDDAGGVTATGALEVGEPSTATGAGAAQDETPDHSALVAADRRDDARLKREREDAKAKAAPPSLDDAKEVLGDAKAKVGEAAAGLRGQATDKAREYALIGKDRASETLHGVSKMLDEAAATVDGKVGPQYGAYARQAAETVRSFAAGIDEKDVDELFEQGRELVRKSPALALGAAAAIGFAMTRVVKAGLDATAAEPATTPGAPTSGPSA